MSPAKTGDNVKIHYTGRLESGEAFDSSIERDPLEFTIGQGQVIQGIEAAVKGMQPGEVKTVAIPPEQGFGEHQTDMVRTFAPSEIPNGLEPQVGQQIQLRSNDGKSFPATIVEIAPTGVTIDANHPLAGRHLTFDIQLLEIAS